MSILCKVFGHFHSRCSGKWICFRCGHISISSYIPPSPKPERHRLHRHIIRECRENIPENKVLVDREFESLFSIAFSYNDPEHVLVYKEDFEKLISELNRKNK
jgi:hypothetical protein